MILMSTLNQVLCSSIHPATNVKLFKFPFLPRNNLLTLIIVSGSDIELGDLVYKPPRNGATLWEIGIADRTAAEFYIPKPDSKYKVHKFKDQRENK